VVMAQIGCWVPAQAMALTAFDRVFTRMGAEDHLVQGQSTFMVELQETAMLLRSGTRRSFLVVDELGRGTSTRDGTAIAAAVLQHLARRRCCGVFATHLACHQGIAGVGRGHMSLGVDGQPAYKLAPGVAPFGSGGIALAIRAGIPASVCERAKEISTNLVV